MFLCSNVLSRAYYYYDTNNMTFFHDSVHSIIWVWSRDGSMIGVTCKMEKVIVSSREEFYFRF